MMVLKKINYHNKEVSNRWNRGGALHRLKTGVLRIKKERI